MDFSDVFPIGANNEAAHNENRLFEQHQSDEIPDAFSKTVAIVPLITGSLSVLGSSTIIFMILSQRKKRLNQSYHRIMLVTSIYDISWSVWLGLGAIPVPRETGAFLALGNHATCQAQAFMTAFGGSVLFSNAFLMTYFLLIVRWNVKERQLARWEPYVHVTIFCYSLAMSLIFFFKGLYSYVGSGPSRCAVGSYPQNCDQSPDVECERGENAKAYLIAFMLVPAGIAFFIMFAAIFGVVWTVNQQLRHSRRRQQFRNNRSEQNNRMVMVQSCLYFFFFVNTFVWINTLVITEQDGAFEILNAIFFPLQGFANAVIYVRPRFLRIRKLYNNKSLWFQIKETIVGNKPLIEHQRLVARSSATRRRVATASMDGSRLTNSTETAADEVMHPSLPNNASQQADHDDGGDCLDPSQMIVERPSLPVDGDTVVEVQSIPSRTRRRSSIRVRDLEKMMEIVADNCDPSNNKDDKKNQQSPSDDIMNQSDDKTFMEISCPTLNPVHGQEDSSTDGFSPVIAAEEERGTISDGDEITELPPSTSRDRRKANTNKGPSSRSSCLELTRLHDSTADFPIAGSGLLEAGRGDCGGEGEVCELPSSTPIQVLSPSNPPKGSCSSSELLRLQDSTNDFPRASDQGDRSA